MAEFNIEALTPEQFANINVGDTVIFGAYVQNETVSRPIEWEILDIKNGNLLLLSKYGLEGKPFNDTNQNAFWEKCSLRAWLNNDFWYGAFNKKERSMIEEVELPAEAPGHATYDKIFCLSVNEAYAYDKKLPVKPTKRAVEAGAKPYFWNGCSEWWLRSTGSRGDIAYVGVTDGIQSSGNKCYCDYAIRPALWLNPYGEQNAQLPGGSDFDYSSLKRGDFFTFGSYEQGNGIEPLVWRVLKRSDNQALLITDKAIDCKKFHHEFVPISWEGSSLRAWMNGEFFEAAFNENEKSRILSVTLDNRKHAPTTDKIFCLSLNEAERYFKDENGGKCFPTEYARSQGAYVSERSGGSCSWWLRSGSLSYNDHVMFVMTDGTALWGGDKVSNPDTAVRPALWISLDN